MGALRQTYLVPQQPFYFNIQAVAVVGTQPLSGVARGRARRRRSIAEVVFDCQLEMDMKPPAPTEIQAVKFAQSTTAVAHRQVVGQQFDLGVLAQKKLPQALEIQPQALAFRGGEKLKQRPGPSVQGFQPVAPLVTEAEQRIRYACRMFSELVID